MISTVTENDSKMTPVNNPEMVAILKGNADKTVALLTP